MYWIRFLRRLFISSIDNYNNDKKVSQKYDNRSH